MMNTNQKEASQELKERAVHASQITEGSPEAHTSSWRLTGCCDGRFTPSDEDTKMESILGQGVREMSCWSKFWAYARFKKFETVKHVALPGLPGSDLTLLPQPKP